MSELNFHTVRPATSVGAVFGYIELPAFSYEDIGWKGASEIVTQFNFETSKNFVLRGLPEEPSGVNFVPVISYRVGMETVRYKLWKDVGERLAEALYNGEVIKKNFKIEIWNIETSEEVSSAEVITLMLSICAMPALISNPVNFEDAVGVEYADQENISEMPTTIPTTGLQAWFRADRGITEAGGVVSSWVDSVNGYNMVQATGANKPAYFDSTFGDNSQAYLNFAGGSDKHLKATGLSAFDVAQVFFIGRQVTWTTTHLMFAAGCSLRQAVGANKIRMTSTGGVTVSDDAVLNTPFVVEMRHDENGANFDLVIKSFDLPMHEQQSEVGGLTVAAIPSATEISVGDPTGGTITADMDIAEIIIYNSVLSAADRASLIDYIVNRYNVGAIKIPVEVGENLPQITN
jgi:hypothetical protein